MTLYVTVYTIIEFAIEVLELTIDHIIIPKSHVPSANMSSSDKSSFALVSILSYLKPTWKLPSSLSWFLNNDGADAFASFFFFLAVASFWARYSCVKNAITWFPPLYMNESYISWIRYFSPKAKNDTLYHYVYTITEFAIEVLDYSWSYHIILKAMC